MPKPGIRNVSKRRPARRRNMVQEKAAEGVSARATVNEVLERLAKLEAGSPTPVLERIEKTLNDLAAALVSIAHAPARPASPPPADPPKPKKGDRATCKHPSTEKVSDKLVRCTACGAVLDAPKVEAPEPPTFEVFREAAVAYAQKHGKVKMLEVVKPFVEGEEVKLSLVPEAKRAAAIAALEV